MERMSTRGVRTARGTTAASVATFVALLSHVAGGGAMPGWIGIVLPWVFSVLVCVPLAGKRLSVVRLGIAVSLSQALFHVLFVLGTGSATALVGTGHHGTVLLAGGGAGADPVASAIVGDAPMWAAHVAAAALTILALHRGERILKRLGGIAADAAAWFSRSIRVLSAVRGIETPREQRVAMSAAPPARRPILLTAVVRRGPPVALV